MEIQGRLSELKFSQIALSQGYMVSEPIHPHSIYDYIVDNGEQLLKIQVKSCRSIDGFRSKGKDRYRVDISHGSGNNKKPYPEGVLDYFAIHLVNEDVWYIIPQSELNNQRYVGLYAENPESMYHQYKNNFDLLKI